MSPSVPSPPAILICLPASLRKGVGWKRRGGDIPHGPTSGLRPMEPLWLWFSVRPAHLPALKNIIQRGAAVPSSLQSANTAEVRLILVCAGLEQQQNDVGQALPCVGGSPGNLSLGGVPRGRRVGVRRDRNKGWSELAVVLRLGYPWISKEGLQEKLLRI